MIDGRFDEPAWAAAPWTDDFVDIEGDVQPKPRYRTRARMLWDDDYLYIAADMEEPHVWATLTEHDSVIFQDNDFEVFIDPDGDNHQYYEIEINALNTVWDLRLVKPYRDGGPALNEWEIPGLMTAVHVQGTLNDASDIDAAWTVEMALPWAALAGFAGCAAPPAEGDQWRINFSRVQWTTDVIDGCYVKRSGLPEDNWVWSPQGIVDMHRPERWGYVQFACSTAADVPFVPDPAWKARERLHAVYYAQRAHHEATCEWAASAGELDLRGGPDGIEVELSESGYVASLRIAYPDGSDHCWCIREDSRIWECGGPLARPNRGLLAAVRRC